MASNLGSFVKSLRDIMRNDAGINGDAQRIEQIAWLLFLKVYDAKEEEWETDEYNYKSIIPENLRWRNWAQENDENRGKLFTDKELLEFVNNKLIPTLAQLEVTPQTPIKKSIVRTTFEDTNNYMKDGVLLRQVVNKIAEIDFSDYNEIHAFGEIYESILKELQNAGSSGEFYTPRAVTQFMAKVIEPKVTEKMADLACGTGGFITSWLHELESQKGKSIESLKAYNNSVYGIEKKQFPYILCVTNLLLHGIENPDIHRMNSLEKKVREYTEKEKFDVILMNPPYGGHEKDNIQNNFPKDLRSSETADLFMSVIMHRLKENGRAAVILPDGFLFGSDTAKDTIKKNLLNDFNLHTIVRLPKSVFAPYTSITTNILFFEKKANPNNEIWFYRLDMPEGYKNFSKTKPMKIEHFAPVFDWWNNRTEIEIDGYPKAKKFTKEELENLGYNFDQCGYPKEEEEVLPTKDLIYKYHEERTRLNQNIDKILTEITNMLGIDLSEDNK